MTARGDLFWHSSWKYNLRTKQLIKSKHIRATFWTTEAAELI